MADEMGGIEMVSTASRLAEVVDVLLQAPRVAVDLESNGFFRYHECVCLVQLSAGETAFLVDPLAIDDMGPLGVLLGDRSVEKVFHAADYDIRSLDRDWGFRVVGLFDTGIAAAFVGSSQLGLQSVVEQQIGLVLAKPRKLQRSDWTRRPLEPEALRYAADDVLHLQQVREALSARLQELSRLEMGEGGVRAAGEREAYSGGPRAGLPFGQGGARPQRERPCHPALPVQVP